MRTLRGKTIRAFALALRRARLPLAGWPAQFSSAFLMAYHNGSLDGVANGEEAFLRWAAARLGLGTCLDVGANVGDWTASLRAAAPDAHVHCFEPLSLNFEKLAGRFDETPRITLNHCALGAAPGTLTLRFNRHYQTTASAAPVASDLIAPDADGRHGELGHLATEEETVPVDTPAAYLARHGIAHIDLLKIDVEGLDLDVLSAFPALGPSVRAIQFEYSLYSRLNHVILKDFHELLVPAGYGVYKLFPGWLDPAPYDIPLERVAEGNYIALHESVLTSLDLGPEARIMLR